jgi:predicted dehydrogenase
MIRWGIAGPGGIAATFAEAMARVDGGEVVAVASRSQERADAFGDRFEIPRRYGDYRAMADDADVDAVYVATIQTRHAADAILYLDAGKHVLCEKPLAINAGEVVAMTDAAERSNRFLMEALWSRFLPSYRRLVELIGEGRIGEPLHVDADFGFRPPIPRIASTTWHRAGVHSSTSASIRCSSARSSSARSSASLPSACWGRPAWTSRPPWCSSTSGAASALPSARCGRGCRTGRW